MVVRDPRHRPRRLRRPSVSDEGIDWGALDEERPEEEADGGDAEANPPKDAPQPRRIELRF